jgi:transcription initiation factor IIE alpha subunit
MGLKHLIQIENIFRKSEKPITKTQIRDTLNTDMAVVEDALAYLLSKKHITFVTKGKRIKRYKWNGEPKR